MAKYQTDYSGHIYIHGCLLCELITIAENRSNKEMGKDDFIHFIRRMNIMSTTYDPSIPILSDENDKSKEGSFVWDHARLVNEYLYTLGYTRYVIEYIGRIYMPWEVRRGKSSFGDRVNADEIILQILTDHGNGHFRGPNHDPWKPGTKMIDLKSLRYYRWVKR